MSDNAGFVLTVADVNEVAVRIAEMWEKYNTDRRVALKLGEEARRFLFATDIDATSADALPHKNRTHQPKLTEISDTLQSEYFEASLSMPKFFKYNGESNEDKRNAKNIESWVRTKLEQRKFRETVGRQLLNDYVTYGNCFASVDYIVERGDEGEVTYQGPDIRRLSPVDIAFNPRGVTFAKTPKLERSLVHVADLQDLPTAFPNGNFDKAAIKKAVASRSDHFVDDWVEIIKERGIEMDGFGSMDEYYKQDLVELIVYRGDVFDPATGKIQRRRVVYVVDKVHVIRNEPTISPMGYDGVHQAGWRIRSDNLWSQGPLDNLVGMQYRVDHLENLKADVFDIIAHPVIKIKGDDVIEPAEGYAPGAVYYLGSEAEVEMLVPDTTALNADSQIAQYHALMERFAGVVPEARGVRTPGEKTAFEVDKLDQGATKLFVDKARNFETMMESLLRETFELMLINYDGSDYVEIFDDVKGEKELKQLALESVKGRGTFTAVGARHWQRRNRMLSEIQNFMQGPFQDPKVRMHLKGETLARMIERHMDLENDEIIEPFAGVKEDVHAQAIAQAEATQFQEEQASGGGEVLTGDASGTGTEVPPGPEDAEGGAIPT